MRKLFKLLIFTIIVMVISFVFINTKTVNAENFRDLHSITKIYESSNEDYYIGCEDYEDYEYSNPAITVLTHGLGGQYYHWSNDFSIEEGEKFFYNEHSIIKKIYDRLNGNFYLYYVQAGYIEEFADGSKIEHSEGLWFYRVNLNDYINGEPCVDTLKEVDHISADKHIVILFDSKITGSTNEDVYGQFHNMMDNISLQFYNLTGSLPKFNLIGHSRGGVINLMYATEHIYNVSSIYSMGTPYNGTKLGAIDHIMGFLDYYEVDEHGHVLYDEDNEPVINSKCSGVADIFNEQVSIDLRNAWNEAYDDSINIDVVAYGGVTSIEFLEALVDEIHNNSRYEDYKIDNDYFVKLISVVLNVIDSFPELSAHIFTDAGGIIQVTEEFTPDLYYYLLSEISNNLIGNVTAGDVAEILRLFDIYNDKAVILDDLFIDTDSQFGRGFSDGIEYEGFDRRMKIFSSEDLIDASATPSNPGIPHNLEIMNPTIINSIVTELEFGCFTETAIQIADDFSGNYSVDKPLSFKFSPTSTGKRKFSANTGEVTLYKYVNSNLQKCELDTTYSSSVQYEFEKGVNYLFIVEPYSNTVNINLELVSSLELKLSDESVTINDVALSYTNEKVLGVKVAKSGYYYIKTNNQYVVVKDKTKEEAIACGNNKYYIYLDSEIVNYVYFSSIISNIISSIQVLRIDNIDINELNEITMYKDVVYFTNRFAHTMSFEIELSSNSTNNLVKVYDEDSEYLTDIVSSNNSKYSFTLSSGESCYIVVTSTVATNSFIIKLIEEQFLWKINGVEIEGEQISLPRGFTYSATLWILNGTIYEEVEHDIEFLTTPGVDYTYLSADHFSINSGATLYNQILLECTDIGIPLTIIIENNFIIDFASENDEMGAYLSTKSNKSSCILLGTYSNTYGTYSFSLDTSNVSKWFTISSYVFDQRYENPKNTTVTVKSIIYKGITFNLPTYFTYTVDVKFGGGNGTSSNPYQINCFRHLNNIRYYTGSNYYYVQTDDIILNREEEWIPISSFSGHYDGAGCSIIFLTMKVDTNCTYYGFVGILNGVIENVLFDNSLVTSPGMVSDNDSNNVLIGIIAGYCNSNGIIRNCTIYSGYMIDSRLRQSYVGGICGYNKGTVVDCDVDYVFYISGYAGGIVGFNEGTINNCTNLSVFNYYWSDANGYLGGIAGVNYTNGTITNCQSVGTFIWNSTDDSSGINPYVGGIIGSNKGTYTNCTCTNNVSEFNGIIKKNIFGTITYNQEKYCFAVDGGKVGYST